MGTYYIPRNLRGESRILYIFTVKSLITTGIGALIGAIFYFLIGMVIGEKTVGIVFLAIFAVLGWAIGALKIPNLAGIPFTKNIGRRIIRRSIKEIYKI